MLPISPYTILILTSNMTMNLKGCFSLFGVDWLEARLKIEVQPWKFGRLLGKAPLTAEAKTEESVILG